MRLIVFSLLTFFLYKCQEEVPKVDPSKLPKLPEEATAPLQPSYQTDRIDTPINIPEDTLIHLGDYVIQFKPAQLVVFSDYYGELQSFKEQTDTFGNWHDRARAAEKIIVNKHPNFFRLRDSVRIIYLENSDSIILPDWTYGDSLLDEGYNIEYYFPEHYNVLVRVQWNEGNQWMLIDRKSGRKYYLIGLPYFSPDGKRIFVSGEDIVAGFSYNGIAMHRIEADSLHKEWEIQIANWGPGKARWLSDSTVVLERMIPDWNEPDVPFELKYTQIKFHLE